MISIGKPYIGRDLLEHFDLWPEGQEYLFADPENAVYNDLDLNRGLDTLFGKMSTPLAFLKRLRKPNGTKELTKVLSKWNKAMYMPPKRKQATIQGGTFLFDGPCTVLAHFDESVLAHADVDDVIKLAVERVRSGQDVTSEA